MEKDKVNRSTVDLINAVRVIFAAEVAKDTTAAPTLKSVLALLPELRLDPERPEAMRLPVCRHLSRALDLGEAGPAAAAANALRELEPTLMGPKHTSQRAEQGRLLYGQLRFQQLGPDWQHSSGFWHYVARPRNHLTPDQLCTCGSLSGDWRIAGMEMR